MTSKIEWLRDPVSGKAGYTVNPIKGLCPVGCLYCYARKMYKRYHWNEEIRLEPDVMSGVNLSKLKDGSKVFVGSTMELFGDWVKSEWMKYIFGMVELFPKLTFIFLTKRPHNLVKWKFPPNCWVGVSVTNTEQYYKAAYWLDEISPTVEFISFEPLLEQINPNKAWPWTLDFKGIGIDWIIVGQQTLVSKKTTPKVEWITEIVDAADKAKIPIFLKDNLNPIFAANDCENYKLYRDKLFKFKDFLNNVETSWHLRQEFPKVGE